MEEDNVDILVCYLGLLNGYLDVPREEPKTASAVLRLALYTAHKEETN